jgi:hypothetical protein
MDDPENLLAGFMPAEEFEKQLNVTPRTRHRYQSLPDGLPFVIIGGRTFIPVKDAKAWLERRVRRPNPRR